MLKYIQELEQEDIQNQKEKVDIVVKVKEEVPEKQECQVKFYGLEELEFLDVYLKNIDKLKKLINTNIMNFIQQVKVTNSRTKKS